MAEQSIYSDIARRTGGDIYIGVVGPVRSGKSTFITRFMQELVLPNMEDGYDKERARDEMPQSAAGMTVMTTEPKFVPDEGVAVTLADGTTLRVKMIDCVGYMIKDALGGEENGAERMVKTPWQEEPMPFTAAAEYGTKKVMTEHATIGILLTCDGTIGDIPRASYQEAEQRLVREMKELGKPFSLVLNCADPASPASVALAGELEEAYGVSVALVNCLSLTAGDISAVLGQVLNEFSVKSVGVSLPAWWRALPKEHPVRLQVSEAVCATLEQVRRMGDVAAAFGELSKEEMVESVSVTGLDMGTGRVTVALSLCPAIYYDILSEIAGMPLRDEGAVLTLLQELAQVKGKYDKVAKALEDVENEGYGIVMPELEDLRLEAPAIVRQSGGFGVHLRAAARSIHMLRADITAEINPIVGTEQQSEEFLRNILSELEEEPEKLWHSNMFGKSLYELVSDSLRGKLAHMPEEARRKLSETLGRIINEGSNGLICILL